MFGCGTCRAANGSVTSRDGAGCGGAEVWQRGAPRTAAGHRAVQALLSNSLCDREPLKSPQRRTTCQHPSSRNSCSTFWRGR